MKCRRKNRPCPRPRLRFRSVIVSECLTDGIENITDENGECINHFRGSYDLSLEAYPSAGGTGSGGVPAIGDTWYGINSGDFDVEDLGVITLNRGALLIYIGGTVSDPASWVVKQ